MNVKKIIHEELGQYLEEIGFQYIRGGYNMWQYGREESDVAKEILIISHPYERRNLKALFWTSAYGQGEYKEFTDFISEQSVRGKEYWGYENVGELREVIREFRRLIFTYGLAYLEEISKPATDAIPTEELYKYVYENHKALFEEYQEKLHTREKTPEEVIGIIYEIMEEAFDLPFEEAKEHLCGLAALYGHTICWGDKGEWVWKPEEKVFYVEKILGTKESKNVLGIIIDTWDYLRKHRNEKDTFLFKCYKTTLIYYYRKHPEEKNG